MILKMYCCDETDFVKLFIDMSQYERIKYVELQLKALWIINTNDKFSIRYILVLCQRCE